MTVSAQKPWFVGLARRYVRRKLRTQFDGFWIEGLEAARAIAQREPVIIAATHVAWWDALVAIQIDALLGLHSHCLMDADNLSRDPFFGWLGALPLQRKVGKQALADLRSAAALVDRPGSGLWIFPQGQQRAAHLRPLGLQPGVLWLSRATGARVIPLSLSYVYRQAPQPTILASFGAPIAADTSAILSMLEAQMSASLARIDHFAASGEGAFVSALAARPQKHAVPAAGRLLSLLARGTAKPRLGDGGARL